MKLNRRAAMKALGAAAVVPLAPGCAPRPIENNERRKLSSQIDTVVVVMMENRSFDHYFGALSLDGGQGEVDGLTADHHNLSTDGTIVRPSLADAFCVEDPAHGWGACHDQWNGGLNDGFVTDFEKRYGSDLRSVPMDYHDAATLPFFYGVLEQSVLCQRWFCSLLGPTWPNRYYAMYGHSNGFTANNHIMPRETPTIFERAWKAGRNFGFYYGNLPFVALSPRHSPDDGTFHFHEAFFEHAAAGTLPNLTWVEPSYFWSDDHPPSHPTAGQVFLQSIYQALVDSPQWERTMLIVTYDEHGGFYDHVAPPTVEDDHADKGLGQLGFRVPSLVTGPYVQSGTVSDIVFDHTSIYRTLADLWELDPLSTRDANANSLLDVIDIDRALRGEAEAGITLPAIAADEEVLFADECRGANQAFASGKLVPGALTGQPEMEMAIDARYGGHQINRWRQSRQIHADFLSIARSLGVLEKG